MEEEEGRGAYFCLGLIRFGLAFVSFTSASTTTSSSSTPAAATTSPKSSSSKPAEGIMCYTKSNPEELERG